VGGSAAYDETLSWLRNLYRPNLVVEILVIGVSGAVHIGCAVAQMVRWRHRRIHAGTRPRPTRSQRPEYSRSSGTLRTSLAALLSAGGARFLGVVSSRGCPPSRLTACGAYTQPWLRKRGSSGTWSRPPSARLRPRRPMSPTRPRRRSRRLASRRCCGSWPAGPSEPASLPQGPRWVPRGAPFSALVAIRSGR